MLQILNLDYWLICLMAVMIIVMQMFSLTRAKVTSEILLLIRTSKVMVTEIIHQCEEMLLRGELRSAQVKRKHYISIFSMEICFIKHPELLQKPNIKKIPRRHVLQRELSQVLKEQRRLFTRKHGMVDLIIILNSMTTLKTV